MKRFCVDLIIEFGKECVGDDLIELPWAVCPFYYKKHEIRVSFNTRNISVLWFYRKLIVLSYTKSYCVWGKHTYILNRNMGNLKLDTHWILQGKSEKQNEYCNYWRKKMSNYCIDLIYQFLIY